MAQIEKEGLGLAGPAPAIDTASGNEPDEQVRMSRAQTEAKRRLLVAVSYTHLRAHETVLDHVCSLLLEKKEINT